MNLLPFPEKRYAFSALVRSWPAARFTCSRFYREKTDSYCAIGIILQSIRPDCAGDNERLKNDALPTLLVEYGMSRETISMVMRINDAYGQEAAAAALEKKGW